MLEVHLTPTPLRMLSEPLGPDRLEEAMVAAARARELLRGRRLVHISSTAAGGGVAEMLRGLLGYALGEGVACRWLVLDGTPDFFEVTKRLHHGLHGFAGDGGSLGPRERTTFEAALAHAEAGLRTLGSGDIVVLHDPQAVGLAPFVRAAGVPVVWRSHVGTELHNEWTERAWNWLRGYVESSDGCVFSRADYAPSWLPADRVWVIPPSIDPLSPKNRELDPDVVQSVLATAGILAGRSRTSPAVRGVEGRRVTVARRATVVREGGPLPVETPLVVQVSRWDPLKDMGGVLAAFTDSLPADGAPQAHLVLAGPAADGVADDPEGAAVLAEVTAQWRALPTARRRRASLVVVPMGDIDENALVVNALQRHAAVAVQKSLGEGFGLTVSEAMWKGRPVVASAVGGILDQVVDGSTGLLVDPQDRAGFAAAVWDLLRDGDRAHTLGSAARERVREHFLPVRQLIDWVELLANLLDGPDGPVDV